MIVIVLAIGVYLKAGEDRKLITVFFFAKKIVVKLNKISNWG